MLCLELMSERLNRIILTLIFVMRLFSYLSLFADNEYNKLFKVSTRLLSDILLVFLLARGISSWNSLLLGVYFWKPIVLYLTYLLLGLLSLLWTSNLSVSMLQLLMISESLFFSYFFIVCIYRLDSMRTINQIISISCLSIALFFLVGSFIQEDLFYRAVRGGADLRLGGWIMNPNELGMLCVLGTGVTLLLGIKRTNKIYLVLSISVFLICLLLTASRSSMISLFVLLMYQVYIMKSKAVKFMLFSFLLFLVIISGLYLSFTRREVINEIFSLTGRIPFWKALLNESFANEPVFGYGFMRIYYTDGFKGFDTHSGHMAHNTFIQVLLNLGLVGLFIVFAQLKSVISRVILVSRRSIGLTLVSMLIPLIINSFSEFGIFGESNYGVIFYQIVVCVVGYKNLNCSCKGNTNDTSFTHQTS